jgi:hypothetical protein
MIAIRIVVALGPRRLILMAARAPCLTVQPLGAYQLLQLLLQQPQQPWLQEVPQLVGELQPLGAAFSLSQQGSSRERKSQAKPQLVLRCHGR